MQSVTNWEMIIVNDSPEDESYADFKVEYEREPRITYAVNEKNMGVNFSRNRALDLVSKESKWVIFLDDDDYLAEDALKEIEKLTRANNSVNWFVTNRAYTNGEALTKFPKNNTEYSYAWDYLLLKKGKGDATHCIHRTFLKEVYFSQTVKQGEEWFFFYQLGLRSKMFYHNQNSTLSDGYNMSGGLNFRARSVAEQITSMYSLFSESRKLGLTYHFTFLSYLTLRLLKALIK